MEYNPSKVYNAVNADNIKPGSMGICANILNVLIERVQLNAPLLEIVKIDADTKVDRFITETVPERVAWNFFYLAREFKEKKYRPYKSSEELLEFKHELFPVVKHNDTAYFIQAYGYDHALIPNIGWVTMQQLLDDYTHLDGSPLGVEVEDA